MRLRETTVDAANSDCRSATAREGSLEVLAGSEIVAVAGTGADVVDVARLDGLLLNVGTNSLAVARISPR